MHEVEAVELKRKRVYVRLAKCLNCEIHLAVAHLVQFPTASHERDAEVIRVGLGKLRVVRVHRPVQHFSQVFVKLIQYFLDIDSVQRVGSFQPLMTTVHHQTSDDAADDEKSEGGEGHNGQHHIDFVGGFRFRVPAWHILHHRLHSCNVLRMSGSPHERQILLVFDANLGAVTRQKQISHEPRRLPAWRDVALAVVRGVRVGVVHEDVHGDNQWVASSEGAWLALVRGELEGDRVEGVGAHTFLQRFLLEGDCVDGLVIHEVQCGRADIRSVQTLKGYYSN
mmetsp:Transcript_17689/g.24431  ORF Transcript_17689/g.24431 Transcript_17689/m.24431 type:complete len:281 (+) Transcript_17689:229-1071(+)